MANQKLEEVDGHCLGKCEKCHKEFMIPNQEVETFLGEHDDCKDCSTDSWHHHHDRAPTLCSDCRGPDAEVYLDRERKPDTEPSHNPMMNAVRRLAMAHKVKGRPPEF
jgi:hypothetical protein